MDGDADLVARVRRGDRQAFDDLYDRYADDVFSLCLVILGDPTVARAAAGTAFALVARTRMNPLSEPTRLRSWLLDLARGSALAWSGSPQARNNPVPHGVSAEVLISGAIVPAPTSLRVGLARTFDRAATTAAHDLATPAIPAARTEPTEAELAQTKITLAESAQAELALPAPGESPGLAVANPARPVKTAGRFSRKSAGHAAKAAAPALEHVAAPPLSEPTEPAATVGIARPVELVKRSPDDASAAGSAEIPYDARTEPPTPGVDLASTELSSNVVALTGQYRPAGDRGFGVGAPLLAMDDLEAERTRGPDWRTRPAIAIAASLVVAVASITAALNWPTPSANLSAENFPDAAIVAPSFTPRPSATPSARPSQSIVIAPVAAAPPATTPAYIQPRPVVDHRVLIRSTPSVPAAVAAPTTQPPVAPTPTPTDSDTDNSPPPSPIVTTPVPATQAASATSHSTAPTTPPAGHSTAPAGHSTAPTGNAPTSPPVTVSATPTQPVTGSPSQPAPTAAPTDTPRQAAGVGTIDSGATATL
jgi:DNA-directed RNA polymerase specialized sigma24 family protein